MLTSAGSSGQEIWKALLKVLSAVKMHKLPFKNTFAALQQSSLESPDIPWQRPQRADIQQLSARRLRTNPSSRLAEEPYVL